MNQIFNSKPDITFDIWFTQLDKLAIEEGFLYESFSERSKTYWRTFYDEELTQKQAFYKKTEE